MINIIEKGFGGNTMEEKKKMKSNTEDEYNKVLASADPTIISEEEKERLTREAIKKFKSL
ncbi:hypothetical protein DYY66_1872 [Candidatus Nitrosotalea sp. FS]|uniref:hypothetical protein n=1 Tax=Candidatus Nitrosotalea sp. FS TaxID=2341021 RepID=UPI0014075CD7|nr:hypothetical protein [Candidatus Nitrosotalea sp. FS]NHH96947.1 hypothetical protein [Candidatus Nitrosotalea sp. FS]